MKLAINSVYSDIRIRPEITIDSLEKANKVLKLFPALGAKKMDYDSEIRQPNILQIILDVSGSTEKLHIKLIEYFNKSLIPVLRKRELHDKECIRLGCLLLSDKLIPAWRGYKSLKELDLHPLKSETIDQSGLGCGTALYGAMRTSIFLTAAVISRMLDEGDGEVPTGTILILTDGMNTRPPESASVVKNALKEIGRIRLRTRMFCLNSEDVRFQEVTKATGFQSMGPDLAYVTYALRRDYRI